MAKRPVTLWIFIMMLVMMLVHTPGEQQFVHLARSFLVGRVDFLTVPGSMTDIALFGDKMYWPQGFFPAMLMTPVVFLFDRMGIDASQSILQTPMVFLIWLLVFSIARKLGWGRDDSFFWAESFLVSSVFLGVMLISWSWYFAQVVATLLWLMLIWEDLTQRRYWIMGIIAGCLMLTRVTAGFGVVYFVGLAIYRRVRTKDLVKLLLPVMVALLVAGIYNYVRFGNLAEYGFKYAFFPEGLRFRLSFGVASIHHVWPNIYHSLLAGLQITKNFPFFAVDQWGMSMFLTSPWLFWLFCIKKWTTESKWAMVVILLMYIGLCFYFSLGWRGFGYRYSLDFMPLVLVVLQMGLTSKRLSPFFKKITWISMIANFLMFLSFAGK